jgi:hypothetical protein
VARTIETIGVRVVVEGADKAISDLNKVNRAVASSGKEATGAVAPLGLLGGALGNIATIAAGIISARLISGIAEGIGSLARQAIFGASRVEELEAIMELIGTRAGLSSEELFKARDAIKEVGIRSDSATKLVAEFARRQIDLADAIKLVNIAQDGATLSGEDTTEAMDAILRGILTQRTILLRQRGIIVNMEQAMKEYADSINKSSDELTANERVQAALNAVLKEGPAIAGAYEVAMTTFGKQMRSMPRLVFDFLAELGTPFQETFSQAAIAVNELFKALTLAVSEGGVLRPVIDGLAAAMNRFLAPLIAIVRVVSSFLSASSRASAAASDWDIKMSDAAEGTKEVVEAVSDLGNEWSEEGEKIMKVNADLAQSIGRLWEDFNRRLVQSTFDMNLRRLREEMDFQRRRERDLEDHNRRMADLFTDLEELRTGKRRQEIRAEMTAERQEFEDQRRRFQALLGEAQSEEERQRVQGWIDALTIEHEGQQALLQEEVDAIDAEERLLRERIRLEEQAFARRQRREDEDRRIRLAREEEDFARRLVREEEAAERREAIMREEAAERITLIQEQIAKESAARLQAQRDQEAMLSQSVENQANILEGLTKDIETEVDVWVAKFQEFFDDIDWKAGGQAIGTGIAQGLGDSFGAWMRSQFGEERSDLAKTVADALGRFADFLVRILENEILPALIFFGGLVAEVGLEIGRNIIWGLVGGINAQWQTLIDRVRDLAEAILFEFQIRLGIGSPSIEFFKAGRDMMLGLSEGIRAFGDLPALQVGQAALGTLQAVPASNVTTNNFNLSVSTASPIEPIVDDFHLMQAAVGS